MNEVEFLILVLKKKKKKKRKNVSKIFTHCCMDQLIFKTNSVFGNFWQ